MKKYCFSEFLLPWVSLSGIDRGARRNPRRSIRCEASRLVVSVIGALNTLIPRHGSDLRSSGLSAGRPHEHSTRSSCVPLSSLHCLLSLFVPEFSQNRVSGGDQCRRASVVLSMSRDERGNIPGVPERTCTRSVSLTKSFVLSVTLARSRTLTDIRLGFTRSTLN